MSTISQNDFEGNYTLSQGSTFSVTDPGDPRRLVTEGNRISIWPVAGQDPNQLWLALYDNTVSPPEEKFVFPLTFDSANGVMTYSDSNYKGTGQVMNIQVSLYQDGNFKTLYGVMIFGDPENVGVWGADEGNG